MKQYCLEVECCCPVKLTYLSDFTTAAVNAVAIVTGIKWEHIVRTLMEIAKERACMPTYVTCVTDMLRVSGFATESCHMTVGGFMKMCEDSETTDSYILKVDYYGYLAVVPAKTREGYAIKGIRPTRYDLTNRSIDMLWKYHPGTDNRTGIRRKGFLLPYVTKAHKGLAVVNMNPQDHYVGDCSVRALCAALECSWNEAIDLLASANKYTNPVINSLSNINSALIKLEFERHKALERNNRMLTGKEFAELMTYTYHNRERIFAFVGSSHCAAFLPFIEPDGSVRYKAQDTWDSTDRKIGDYWVIPPRETRNRQKLLQTQKTPDDAVTQKTEFHVGDTVAHKSFGTGTIISVTETLVEVDFSGVGVKRITKDWIKKLK